MRRKGHAILSFLMSAVFIIMMLTQCGGDDPVSSKSEDFDSAEEYMENPSIRNVVNEEDFPINYGDDPPPLAGKYALSGSITDSDVADMIGYTISSNVCLYNQTYDGEIDYAEANDYISAVAEGNYVTGEGGRFTIWQEGDAEVGGCQQHNAMIISGTKSQSGNLTIQTLTVVLKKTDCGGYLVPSWWKTSSYCTLQGTCSGVGDL